MTRSAVFVAWVSLLCLGASSHAQAEEIKSFEVILTGGFLRIDLTDTPPSVQVAVEGTAFSMEGTSKTGFGLAGLGDPNSFVEPLLGCLVCAPGDHIGTNVGIAGWILGGATLDGQDYTFGPNAAAHFNVGGAPITVPAFRPSPVVVTTPVGVFDSAFASFGNSNPDLDLSADIFGSGRVSMTFAPASEGRLWDLRDIRYDFGPTPTPTPEPATLTLVTAGLVASAQRLRKRRNTRHASQFSTSTPRVTLI